MLFWWRFVARPNFWLRSRARKIYLIQQMVFVVVSTLAATSVRMKACEIRIYSNKVRSSNGQSVTILETYPFHFSNQPGWVVNCNTYIHMCDLAIVAVLTTFWLGLCFTMAPFSQLAVPVGGSRPCAELWRVHIWTSRYPAQWGTVSTLLRRSFYVACSFDILAQR